MNESEQGYRHVPEANEHNENSEYQSHLAIAESDSRILEILAKLDQTPENISLMQTVKDDLFYRESEMGKLKATGGYNAK